MSGDYVERLRSFLDAHRPDSARHVTADVLATLPNPDGRGWRHLTGEDLRAALDELEQLRAVVAIQPLDPALKNCLLCGHYFLAHRSDVGCMHCQCTAGVTAPKPRPATAQQLHARFAHPNYEYATTHGPRKAWDQVDEPPEGDNWERNGFAGRDGWERFDYHEESYWYRCRPEESQQPAPEGGA